MMTCTYALLHRCNAALMYCCCSIFIHCAAAVPAYHLRRPVKAILDRDEDMQMTGESRGCIRKQ